MTAQAILAFVQLAIAAVPQVKQIVDDGRALIDGLFSAGLITKDEQAAAHSWADQHEAKVLADAAANKPPLEMQIAPTPAASAARFGGSVSELATDTGGATGITTDTGSPPAK